MFEFDWREEVDVQKMEDTHKNICIWANASMDNK